MTKITDEMVERLLEVPAAFGYKKVGDYLTPSAARKALEAALTPPVPEIEVTEGMLDAGNAGWDAALDAAGCEKESRSQLGDACILSIYRAMESTRIKEEWIKRDGHLQGDAGLAGLNCST